MESLPGVGRKEMMMDLFHENMNEYRKQLMIGAIQEAHKGLMEYIMGLRTYFKSKYPDYFVSGSIYQGIMDMTYFSFTPKSLQQRKLKIAIVFVYDTFRFEVWLAGVNKQVQAKYWELIKESGWNQYYIAPTTKGIDSILEYVLADSPDFGELDILTEQIERGTLKFISDIETFLAD